MKVDRTKFEINSKKHRLWFRSPSGRDSEKHRLWFVIVARRPNLAHCFFVDGPSSSDLRATIPPAFVCACLEKVMVDSQQWPALVAIAPLACGSFRPESVRKIAVSVRDALAPHYSNVEPVLCKELPQDTPGSVMMTVVQKKAMETGMWFVVMDHVVKKLEMIEENHYRKHDRGVGMMARMPGLMSRMPGYIDPNLTSEITETASISQVRSLFEGSKEFHESSAWDTMTNQQYLHLRDPVTNNEVWAMVTGNTDYAGRGLNVYRSFDDILMSSKHGPGARIGGHFYERLQFFGPEVTPFGTLDHVQGLDLPLASCLPQ